MINYISVPDHFLLNGNRHKQNGDKHFDAGNFEYAAGSYRKALRNWSTYLDFREFESSVANTLMQPFVEHLNKQLAETIMYGMSVSQDGKSIPLKDFYLNG